MLKTLAFAAVAVASVEGFSAPTSFGGYSLRAQAASRSSCITMQAQENTSRRAAIGAILGGLIATPAAANAYYGVAKGKDENWQLKTGGVLTDVESSSMSGVRASGFGNGSDAKKNAQKFARPPMTDTDIGTVEGLTKKIMDEGTLSKYKTSNKIGINPGYGGSSGIFTGAK